MIHTATASIFLVLLTKRCTVGDVGRTDVSVIGTTRIAGNQVGLKAWARSRWLSWQLVLLIQWRFPRLNQSTYGEEGNCPLYYALTVLTGSSSCMVRLLAHAVLA